MKRSAYAKLLPIYCCILVSLILIAFLGSRTVTAFRENQAVYSDRVVIIDAGHGGIDGGATSFSGVRESVLNLEIALRLDDLMHLLGIYTIMIRTADVSIHTTGDTIAAKKVSDLKNRVKLVNSIPNSILISIHQNYFSDARYDGAQVFYANGADSRLFAEKVQKTLVSSLDRHNSRRVKSAKGVYLMDKITNTDILVECGFISNPTEDKRLQDAIYQKKLACVLASATCQYICQNPIA